MFIVQCIKSKKFYNFANPNDWLEDLWWGEAFADEDPARAVYDENPSDRFLYRVKLELVA